MTAGKIKALLIDDDEDEFVIMQELISEIPDSPYELSWCADCATALSELAGERHDIYLVDYRLGAENGLNLIREAQALGIRKPFILLTGQGDRSIDMEAMRRGAADYLVKQSTDAATLERSMRYALERSRAADELNRLANFDPLTGLANRNLLISRLSEDVYRAKTKGGNVALVLLDLDRFSEINGTLGYEIGDLLLQTVAERLSGCAELGNLVARLGGDDFALIINDAGSKDDAAAFADRILRLLREPFLLSGQSVRSSCSTGISSFPSDADNADMLFRNADFALMQAKAAGRNTYRSFDESARAALQDRIALAGDLLPGLEREEFRLVYQPIVNVATGEIVGLEALLRWQHPSRGNVPPGEFIPLAESTGTILQIGEWVLRQASRQVAAWRSEGLDIRVAVNLSPRQIQSLDVASLVSSTLDGAGIDSSGLALEVTEGLLVEDSEANVLTLERLRQMGIRVYIDDFGTGYSSLSYLKRLPVTALKIDGSFINGADWSPDDQMIIRAIIGLARNLGLGVVAEGVETIAQMELLLAEGCDIMQGYLFSRPVEADQLVQWCRSFGLERLRAITEAERNRSASTAAYHSRHAIPVR